MKQTIWRCSLNFWKIVKGFFSLLIYWLVKKHCHLPLCDVYVVSNFTWKVESVKSWTLSRCSIQWEWKPAGPFIKHVIKPLQYSLITHTQRERDCIYLQWDQIIRELTDWLWGLGFAWTLPANVQAFYISAFACFNPGKPSVSHNIQPSTPANNPLFYECLSCWKRVVMSNFGVEGL